MVNTRIKGLAPLLAAAFLTTQVACQEDWNYSDVLGSSPLPYEDGEYLNDIGQRFSLHPNGDLATLLSTGYDNGAVELSIPKTRFTSGYRVDLSGVSNPQASGLPSGSTSLYLVPDFEALERLIPGTTMLDAERAYGSGDLACNDSSYALYQVPGLGSNPSVAQVAIELANDPEILLADRYAPECDILVPKEAVDSGTLQNYGIRVVCNGPQWERDPRDGWVTDRAIGTETPTSTPVLTLGFQRDLCTQAYHDDQLAARFYTP